MATTQRKAENENNKKSTETLITVWSTWADEKGFSPDIVSYDAEELDLKLSKFFERKKERKTVRTMTQKVCR